MSKAQVPRARGTRTKRVLRIFVNYRREDSSGHAGRLYDDLAEKFGEEQIFIDIDKIEPGLDFGESIERALSSCDVVLAVMGRHWLTSTDGTGRRRLDNPDDYVRIELETALARGMRLIPVRVQGTDMPSSADLPESLRALSRRQAVELSDTRWRYDVEGLTAALERVASENAEREREARRILAQEQAEQQQAEEERKAREETEHEHAAQALRAAEDEAEQLRRSAEAERKRAEEAERRRREEAEEKRAQGAQQEAEERAAQEEAERGRIAAAEAAREQAEKERALQADAARERAATEASERATGQRRAEEIAESEHGSVHASEEERSRLAADPDRARAAAQNERRAAGSAERERTRPATQQDAVTAAPRESLPRSAPAHIASTSRRAGRPAPVPAPGSPAASKPRIANRTSRRPLFVGLATAAVLGTLVLAFVLFSGGPDEPAAPEVTLPANASLPTVSGTTSPGNSLTAKRGAWNGSPAAFSYRWRRCQTGDACTVISGATGPTYRLRDGDVGSRIRLSVIASNAAGSTTSASKPTAVVRPALVPPKNTARPKVSGQAREGSTLTAAKGVWRGATPISYTYAWLRCNVNGSGCTRVSGSRRSTYELRVQDVGRRMRVEIRASSAGGRTVTQSNATPTVASKPAPPPIAPPSPPTPPSPPPSIVPVEPPPDP